MNGWLLAIMLLAQGTPGQETADKPAEIRVVDVSTGRGIPCAELETTHNLVFVTDNAGRVAFAEPGLMGREIFFSIRCHGYEIPPHSFGFRGAKVTPQRGK
ncbi:MAG: hypothetical protein ACKOS8_11275, partial [Gemmataceae bacterium]